MEAGNIAAMLMAKAKAANRREWEASVHGIWDQAVTELRTNPGFKGLVALWNNDDSGQVAVIGLWDNLEHRLAYEARSADKVRGFFNPLFQEVPERPRFVVTRAVLE